MSTSVIIAGEIIAAVVTGISEYLKASNVKQEEVDKMLDEAFAKIRNKKPENLPDV